MNKNDRRHLITAALQLLAALLRVLDRHGDGWPFW